MASSSSSESIPVRCQELWFTDGTIVLRCEKTVFRVYQGILTAQSLVFRDMFELPQPEDAEKFEGNLVVDLQDNIEDLTLFLRTIFDTCFYDENKENFRIISAILRLSTKYQVVRLRRRTIHQLTTAYPTTLDQFTRLLENPELCEIQSFEGIDLAVVNLAEETDVPQVLPAAYYKLLNLPDRIILQGIHYPEAPNAPAEMLCPRGLTRCLVGRDALRTHLIHEVYRPLLEPCSFHMTGCNHWRIGVMKVIDEGLAGRKLGLFHGAAADMSGLCPGCHGVAMRTYERAKYDSWAQLPDFFDLPGWEVLLMYYD